MMYFLFSLQKNKETISQIHTFFFIDWKLLIDLYAKYVSSTLQSRVEYVFKSKLRSDMLRIRSQLSIANQYDQQH